MTPEVMKSPANCTAIGPPSATHAQLNCPEIAEGRPLHVGATALDGGVQQVAWTLPRPRQVT